MDYPRSTVLQMIGRAGRPQFDSSGLAVILTKRKTEKKFRDIASGQIPVESNILNYLLEHINAAISLDLINCKQDAVSWLKSSFFFVRAKKNPGNYGILNEQLERNYLDNFVSECFQKLESKSLMETLNNSDDASKVKSTQFGIVMAKNYIMFETMANLLESKQDFNEEELLNLISKAEEYKSINIRMGEKKCREAVFAVSFSKLMCLR